MTSRILGERAIFLAGFSSSGSSHLEGRLEEKATGIFNALKAYANCKERARILEYILEDIASGLVKISPDAGTLDGGVPTSSDDPRVLDYKGSAFMRGEIINSTKNTKKQRLCRICCQHFEALYFYGAAAG